MENNLKDRIFYRIVKATAVPLVCKFLHYKGEPCEVEGPFLGIANHTTDLDPAFVARAFKSSMYFVTSEHAFRKGFLSKLLVFIFNPIARKKGSTDAAAALDIVRKLRNGSNVFLFAEGNRSFNGVTGPVFPATGKLLKAARCSLVTYRIRGGYLTTPRWADTTRKASVMGELVHVYTPEQLAAMTPDEINAAIAADIYEDAFDRQEKQRIAFCGKRLAEHLERALYCCPKCKKADTLSSEGDLFRCTCGFTVRYTETGFFAPVGEEEEIPFTNVRDWDKWQIGRLEEIVSEAVPGSVLVSDEGATLSELKADHGELVLAHGRLTATKEKLSCESVSFSWSDISDLAVCGPSRVAFTTADARYYEIAFDGPSSGKKYLDLFSIIKK